MNNERYNQIIKEVYRNYADSHWIPSLDQLWRLKPMQHSKESFIHEIKTNPEFSEKWGLKIEERELSLEERNQWFHINWNANNPLMKSDWKFYELDQQNVPTKLITVTYNDEKIEVYE